MRRFRFHWVGGKTEESDGIDVADAFGRLGYGRGALPALDWYEQIKEQCEVADTRIEHKNGYWVLHVYWIQYNGENVVNGWDEVSYYGTRAEAIKAENEMVAENAVP